MGDLEHVQVVADLVPGPVALVVLVHGHGDLLRPELGRRRVEHLRQALGVRHSAQGHGVAAGDLGERHRVDQPLGHVDLVGSDGQEPLAPQGRRQPSRAPLLVARAARLADGAHHAVVCRREVLVPERYGDEAEGLGLVHAELRHDLPRVLGEAQAEGRRVAVVQAAPA